MPQAFTAHRALLLTLSILSLTACNQSSSQPSQAPPRPALVVQAGGTVQQGPAYIAEVRAMPRAELAFAVPGRVARLHADVGDTVRAGQILAELDATPLRAQLEAASNEEAAARARLQEVRQRHARLLAAQQGQAIGAGEMDAVKAELDAAGAALGAASSQRAQAEWALAQASLRASIDGVVSSRQLTIGQSAGPGASAFTIEGKGRELALWLPAHIRWMAGQRVTLRHEGQSHEATVLRVSATLGAGGQRQVFISAPAHAQVGDTWQVMVGDQADNGIRIPLRALLPDRNAQQGYVLRLAADGHTVEKVAVVVGELQSDHVRILSGLKPDDLVVIAGAAAINPGTRVTPVLMGEGRERE